MAVACEEDDEDEDENEPRSSPRPRPRPRTGTGRPTATIALRHASNAAPTAVVAADTVALVRAIAASKFLISALALSTILLSSSNRRRAGVNSASGGRAAASASMVSRIASHVGCNGAQIGSKRRAIFGEEIVAFAFTFRRCALSCLNISRATGSGACLGAPLGCDCDCSPTRRKDAITNTVAQWHTSVAQRQHIS